MSSKKFLAPYLSLALAFILLFSSSNVFAAKIKPLVRPPQPVLKFSYTITAQHPPQILSTLNLEFITMVIQL